MTGKQKFLRVLAIFVGLGTAWQMVDSLSAASVVGAAPLFALAFYVYRLSGVSKNASEERVVDSNPAALRGGRIHMTESDGVRRIEVKPMWVTRIFAVALLGFAAFGFVGMMRFPPPYTIPTILLMLFISGNCVLLAMFAFRTMLGGEIFEFRKDELYYRVGMAPYARVSIYKYREMKNPALVPARAVWFDGAIRFEDQAEFGYPRFFGRHLDTTQAVAMIQLIETYIDGASSSGEGKASGQTSVAQSEQPGR